MCFRCVTVFAGLLVLASLASAQEKPAKKSKKTGYAKVEIMGTLHKSDGKDGSWVMKYSPDGKAEFAVPVAFREEPPRRLLNKKVVVTGELFYMPPITLQPGFGGPDIPPMPPTQISGMTLVIAHSVRKVKTK